MYSHGDSVTWCNEGDKNTPSLPVTMQYTLILFNQQNNNNNRKSNFNFDLYYYIGRLWSKTEILKRLMIAMLLRYRHAKAECRLLCVCEGRYTLFTKTIYFTIERESIESTYIYILYKVYLHSHTNVDRSDNDAWLNFSFYFMLWRRSCRCCKPLCST